MQFIIFFVRVLEDFLVDRIQPRFYFLSSVFLEDFLVDVIEILLTVHVLLHYFYLL